MTTAITMLIMTTAATSTKLTKKSQLIGWSSIAVYITSVQSSRVMTRNRVRRAMPSESQCTGSWSRKRCTPATAYT